MRSRDHFVNVRPFLGLALVATAAVIGLPFLVVLAWVVAGSPSAIGLVIAAFISMTIVFALGAALWKRRGESADISFGELMIWGWLLRKRADDRLLEGARLLGLDRSGQPTEPAKVTPQRQIAVLHELNAALESKDPYTHGHSQRVERHVYRTGAAMGLSSGAIDELRFAAALHDVGKIRVPDRVLRKPSGLTSAEREIVEEHVVVGAWMVSNVASADVVSAVRHHHERWDGRGYPDGLAGTDIPLYARIIAVADAYDAITSTRPYRVSAGREHAVDILRTESGTQFDPMIVTAFVEALPVRLPVAGMIVFLTAPSQALVRRLAVWFKRLGAGHLAPTAASLAAVVTLGSFVPLPATPAGRAPAIAAPAPAPGTQDAIDAPKKPHPERIRVAETRTARASARFAPKEDVVLGETVVRDRTADARPEPKPEPQPEPAIEPEPEPESEAESTGKKNKNDGEDGCHNDGNAGHGNDSTCGEDDN